MKLKFSSKKIVQISLQCIFAVGLAFLLCQNDFLNLDFLEFLSYDMLVRTRPTPPTSGLIHLIAVDRRSVTALNGEPGIAAQTLLLKSLLQHPPKAVVYALKLQNLRGTREQFKEFAETAARFPHLYVATDDVALHGRESDLLLKPPLNHLHVVSGPKTYDERIFAKDSVTRRMVIDYNDQVYLHPQVAALFTKKWKKISQIRGLFSFYDSQQALINFHPKGTYPEVSLVDAIRKPDLGEQWQNKIVIIGVDTAENGDDYIKTPYSRTVLAMSMLEAHANMIDTMITNSAPIRAPKWLGFLLTALIALFTAHVSLRVRPTRGLKILGITVVAYVLIAYLLFAGATYWIAVAPPLLAIFISYYFFIPYRLIMENRRSWEYYQKNQLLTQVEELKTNFLSMMSHDLKTPLARIQGMSDVLAKDENPLSPQQATALVSIRNSSEELISFISSILDLGRVDSKEVKLNLASRDINSLLNQVIHKYEFLAKERNIELIEEFEPLFSLKMDVHLMQQVFSNLVENAIKYSPPGKKVLISTEEAKGKVVIQIADQGFGIAADELPNIFMKFYRSKDARSSTVKGSGLGLYLARYFVELHRGTIVVDSAQGQGTTFTVELPMELA